MKYRAIAYGTPLPQDFLDALQEFVSTATHNLRLTAAGTTSVQILAGVGNDQVSCGILGLWRYNTATVTAAHPGGAAGQYDIFVVASANSFTAGVGNEVDSTDYSFGLVIVAHNATPSGTWNGRTITASRKLGEVTWSGTAITSIQNLLAQPIPAQVITSANIQDGTIVDADLAADTLTARVIAAGAVGASEIADGTITDVEVASANKDGTAGTASLRTLGTGSQQAAAGNDSRLSNARTPTPHVVTHFGVGATDGADLTQINMAGTRSARLAFTLAAWNAGAYWFETDTLLTYRSTGAAWVLATYAPPAPATTLPGSPVDKQQAILVDSTTAPTYAWTFQWSSVASKWIFIGGVPVHLDDTTANTFSSGSYTDFANNVSFAVPRAGDYWVNAGAQADSNGTGNVRVSLKRGSATTVDADAVIKPGMPGNDSGSRSFRVVGLGAGDVLKLQALWSAVSGGPPNSSYRSLDVLPIAVT